MSKGGGGGTNGGVTPPGAQFPPPAAGNPAPDVPGGATTQPNVTAPQNPNMYQQAANSITGGMAGAGQAAGMYGSVNPIYAGMGAYTNPYETDVINNFGNDLARQTAMQQQANANKAIGSGAFGGARHGLVEAQTNEASQRALGDFSSQLRHQGFTTAAGLANQDIQNQMGAAAGLLGSAGMAGQLGQQGFDMVQAIQQQQSMEGGLLQGMQQMLLDNAQNMFNQHTGSPLHYLNMRNAAASGSPLNNATTQTSQYNPGLFDYLSLGMQGLGSAFPGGWGR